MDRRVIRYKVVAYKNNTGRFYSVITSAKLPHKSSYVLEYSDIAGTRVKAHPWTLGVMTFRDVWSAMLFAKLNNEFMVSPYETEILRVRGIGRGRRPKWISRDIPHLDRFYGKDFYFILRTLPPMETICYQEVEVIDCLGYGLINSSDRGGNAMSGFWGKMDNWNYDRRQQAVFPGERRYGGLDHSEELAGMGGIHIHFWVDSALSGKERRRQVKKAYHQALGYRDIVAHSYGTIPVAQVSVKRAKAKAKSAKS